MLVVFVCTGNICRSPMAEGMLRHRLNQRGVPGVDVCSMGVIGLCGHPAAPSAVQVCQEHGVDISAHRAQGLIPSRLKEASHILVMELVHREDVIDVCPGIEGRVWMTGAWPRTVEHVVDAVPDPVGGSQAVFREVYAILDCHVQRIASALARIRLEQHGA